MPFATLGENTTDENASSAKQEKSLLVHNAIPSEISDCCPRATCG